NQARDKQHQLRRRGAAARASFRPSRWLLSQKLDGHAKNHDSGSASFPDLPRRIFAGPGGFELAFVAERVHTLPKAVVFVRHKLIFVSEMFKRVRFQNAVVVFEVIEYLGLKHEK